MSMNITTKAGTHARIEEMEGMYFSDFHKDVYGYRPRGGEWTSWVEMSAVAFNEALDRMMAKMEADIAQEKLDEEAALVEFKKELKAVMVAERCDWKEAMTCMLEADAVEKHMIDHWLWEKNLSFAKQNEIAKLYLGGY